MAPVACSANPIARAVSRVLPYLRHPRIRRSPTPPRQRGDMHGRQRGLAVADRAQMPGLLDAGPPCCCPDCADDDAGAVRIPDTVPVIAACVGSPASISVPDSLWQRHPAGSTSRMEAADSMRMATGAARRRSGRACADAVAGASAAAVVAP